MDHRVAERPARLEIGNLALRHPGIPPGIGGSYAETARVCLQRHHRSPKLWSVRAHGGLEAAYLVEWAEPEPDHIRGCANHDEATRDGAYCLALAAAEAHMQLVALRHSEGLTGATST